MLPSVAIHTFIYIYIYSCIYIYFLSSVVFSGIVEGRNGIRVETTIETETCVGIALMGSSSTSLLKKMISSGTGDNFFLTNWFMITIIVKIIVIINQRSEEIDEEIWKENMLFVFTSPAPSWKLIAIETSWSLLNLLFCFLFYLLFVLLIINSFEKKNKLQKQNFQ